MRTSTPQGFYFNLDLGFLGDLTMNYEAIREKTTELSKKIWKSTPQSFLCVSLVGNLEHFEDDVVTKLSKDGIRVHYLAPMRSLVFLAFRVLYELPPEMRAKYYRSMRSALEGSTFPLPMILATWYLYKLNVFRTKVPMVKTGDHTMPFFCGWAYSVYSVSVQTTVEEALEIIRASKWQYLLPKIKVWFV